MPNYLLLGKYSAAGARAACDGGLTTRKQAVEQFTTALGFKQLGWWAVAEAEWDFAIQVEGTYRPDVMAAQGLLTYGSGAFERTQVLTLVETEDVDNAQECLPGYRAPGE